MSTYSMVITRCAGVLFLLIPVVSYSASSDWLKPVAGDTGKVIGAQVREVAVDEHSGRQTVTVAIPKSALDDPGEIEEIVVVGKRPPPKQPVIEADYEWVDNYARDHYGLILHINGDDAVWPIRLFFSDGNEVVP